ncbi:MAG: hypothetical protein RMJ89_02605 [Flammeovirgaceae bacterium]|nr:hypothetical protein [Flammeovirgaceae bacterium]
MKHELLTCPRCHKLFECKVGNVAHCQCNIVLHPETTHFLRKRSTVAYASAA